MKIERPSAGAVEKAIETLAKTFYANVVECLEKNPGWNSEDERLEEHREGIIAFLKCLAESRFASAHLVKAEDPCEKCGSAHAYSSVGVTSVREGIAMVHHLLENAGCVLNEISNDMVEDALVEDKAEGASEENVTPIKKDGACEECELTPEEEARDQAEYFIDHMPLRIAARLVDEADNVLCLHEMMTQGPDGTDAAPQEMDAPHLVH
jgi:hypothetical protein